MLLQKTTKVRKCGRKKEGGVYFVGGEPSKEGSSPVFTLINPPVPYPVPVHRSWRLVDDQAILNRMPLEEWWVGVSESTEVKKRGDAFWVDLFGLPLEKRLGKGVCSEVDHPDEVLATIAGRVAWNSGLVALFRNLTINEAQNMPNAAVHFDGIRTSMVEFTQTEKVDALVTLQSRIWQLAGVTKGKDRSNILPTLERMLILMGLTEDAIYMDNLYN